MSIEKVKAYFKQFGMEERVREFTVEAGRPDTITREKLLALKQAGARRVTLHGVADVPVQSGIRDVQRSPEGVSFLYGGEMNVLIRALARLDVRDMTVAEPDLEEVFMHYYEEGGDRA